MGSSNSKNSSNDGRAQAAAQKDIRESDRLIIDASALQCPICLNIFVQSPFVLQCGHSFCRNCTKHFVRPPCNTGTSTLVECPMCLRRFTVLKEGDPNQLAVVNFGLDNVLDGVRAMARVETDDMEAIALIPTLRFECKRLRAELEDKDRMVVELRAEREQRERKMGALKAALAKIERECTELSREKEQPADKAPAISCWKSAAAFLAGTASLCALLWFKDTIMTHLMMTNGKSRCR